MKTSILQLVGLSLVIGGPLAAQSRAVEVESLLRAASRLEALHASRAARAQSQVQAAYRLAQARSTLQQFGLADPDLPAAEFFPADSADDLFREARTELRRRNYQAAYDLFRELQQRFPESRYVPQAMYYQAFALHRMGGDDNLRRALAILDTHLERFPNESRDVAALRIQVLGTLGRRGDAEAAAEIAARADRVVATQRVGAARAPLPPGVVGQVVGTGRFQEDDDVRMQALNALLQMDAANAIPILRRVLENRIDDNVRLRRRAIFLVSQKRHEDREEILLDAVRNDPDDEVKQQAVFFLSQVRTDAAVDALDSIVRNTTDPTIAERAIFALSQHRSERAGEALRTFVRRADVSADLRARAIQSLGQNRRHAPFLRQLYPELTDPELRAQVLFAVSQSRSEDNVDFLIAVAADASEPIEARKRALFWAGQMRDARARLVELYDRTDDPEMREQLIFVFGQSRDSSVVTKLIDIARNETNTRLQSRAIFWLGQSRDPRAVAVLDEIINRRI